MSLRHAEDVTERSASDQTPSDRLSPDEARAFLQVHAEREAAPGATTVADLSESLQLPESEVRAILREARSRLAESAPRKRRRPLRPVVALATFAVFVVALLQIAFVRRAAPSHAVLGEPAVATTAPVSAERAMIEPPPGFEIEVSVPGGAVSWEGPPAKFGTDFRQADRAEAGALQSRLTDGVLSAIETALRGNADAWRHARKLVLRTRIANGGWTTTGIPLKPFTLPFADNPAGRESLRKTLLGIYATQWKAIVDRAPR